MDATLSSSVLSNKIHCVHRLAIGAVSDGHQGNNKNTNNSNDNAKCCFDCDIHGDNQDNPIGVTRAPELFSDDAVVVVTARRSQSEDFESVDGQTYKASSHGSSITYDSQRYRWLTDGLGNRNEPAIAPTACSPPSLVVQGARNSGLYNSEPLLDLFLSQLEKPSCSCLDLADLSESVILLTEQIDGCRRCFDYLLNAGVIPHLARLVDRLVRDHDSVCTLQYRNYYESTGMRMNDTCPRDDVLEAVALFLCNLLYCSFPDQPNAIEECIGIIRELLRDDSVWTVSHACWSLCSIVYMGDDDDTCMLRDMALLRRLVEIVDHTNNYHLLKAALAAVDSLVEIHPQPMIDCGAVLGTFGARGNERSLA